MLGPLARLAAAALGVWLMAAPAVLGTVGTPAAIGDRIAGPLIAALAIVAHWAVTRPLRRVNIVLGLWLVVSPAVLGTPGRGAVSDVVTGALVAALALVRDPAHERFGGGWRALWRGGEERAQL